MADEKPSVYVIACHKCLREYSLHGTETRLAICLLNEGWVKGDLGMICPRCPAANDAKYNKERELKRKLLKATRHNLRHRNFIYTSAPAFDVLGQVSA